METNKKGYNNETPFRRQDIYLYMYILHITNMHNLSSFIAKISRYIGLKVSKQSPDYLDKPLALQWFTKRELDSERSQTS